MREGNTLTMTVRDPRALAESVQRAFDHHLDGKPVAEAVEEISERMAARPPWYHAAMTALGAEGCGPLRVGAEGGDVVLMEPDGTIFRRLMPDQADLVAELLPLKANMARRQPRTDS